MRYLLDILYLVATVLGLPLLAWRVIRGKSRSGWRQRFGFVPHPASAKPVIWLHAVSVGEANATRTLAGRLARDLPGHELAFSATTDTGMRRLAELYPHALRFRFPLDFSFAVGRVLRRLKPALIVLMELEVWPNLLRLADAAGVPVVVANGRLSEKSFRWYRPLRLMLRPMFARLASACVQDFAYAGRFAVMGVPPDRVTVTGSLKYDTADQADAVAGADRLAAALGLNGSSRLLVAGSTGPGEEEILLEAFRRLRTRHPDLQLAIVPRKPERFDEVAAIIERSGLSCRRRSLCTDDQPAAGPLADDSVILGDTMGEMRKFYSLASLIFVGRSLVPLGGSDVMEAAAPGRAVLVGPHTHNFAEPVSRLRAAGGLAVVADDAALEREVDRLLSDPAAAVAMAAAARNAVLAARGATDRTAGVIRDILAGSAERQAGR